MTAVRIDCVWCGRKNRTRSGWEQANIRTGEYEPLCVACCNKRRGRSALLDVRRITTEGTNR